MLELIFALWTMYASTAQLDERLVQVRGVVCDDGIGVSHYLDWEADYEMTPDSHKFKRWLPQCDHYKDEQAWVREHELMFHTTADSLFIIGAIRLPHSKRVRYGIIAVVPLRPGDEARLWPRPFCLLKWPHETQRKLSLPSGYLGGGSRY